MDIIKLSGASSIHFVHGVVNRRASIVSLIDIMFDDRYASHLNKRGDHELIMSS